MMTSHIKFLTLSVTAGDQIYLTRCYYCVIDNLRSPSVVGPLLFLIYKPALSSYARLYADETSLTTSATDPDKLQFK